MRDELFNTAVAANLGPTREGRALLLGSGGKPADVFIPHWAGGKDVAHNRKLAKSFEPCQQEGITFVPIAVESLGAWHKSAVKEINKLASSKLR